MEEEISSQSIRRLCLTPTRNEAWIIKPFLEAAKCWANQVIVADQGSTDGTWEQLQENPGVIPVANRSPTFDENHRQRLLLESARKIPGKRILIGLDADEALSANSIGSQDWERINAAKLGTILRFRWVNVLPGFEKAWIPKEPVPFGFIDDGTEHTGRRIHSPRVPQPANAPVLDLENIVVLHFQYVVWQRMRRKQRWYQTWEHTTHREKRPLDIFRQYNHMYGSWKTSEIHPLRSEWLDQYERAGIDFKALKCEPVTWWDREIARMLSEQGPRQFRKLAIWDEDWNAVAQRVGLAANDLSDPRSIFEKSAHRLLALTQNRRENWSTRGLERILRMAGW